MRVNSPQTSTPRHGAWSVGAARWPSARPCPRPSTGGFRHHAYQDCRSRLPCPALVGAVAADPALTQTPRPLALGDLASVRELSDPQRSPDGQWVAYVVTTWDFEKDERDSDVWMVSWDGSRRVRLTSSEDSEATPRWSPDGRYLAFTVSHDEDESDTQVWLLDRAGGESQKLTDVKGSVSDYAWSPDGKRLVLRSTIPIRVSWPRRRRASPIRSRPS